MGNQWQDLRETFETQGFVIVDNLFSEDDLTGIETFFEEYKRCGQAVFDKGTTFEEIDPRERQVRAMHPHRYSQKAMNWLLHPSVAEVLEALFGRAPLGVQTMYYYKPPGAKGQGMHQDNFYLLAKPHACMAAWTPIDDTDTENGCLCVVPGSHREEILCPETGKAKWRNYEDSHITGFPSGKEPIPVPVKRGHTLFFGGQLIHGSGPNRTTDRYRRTFIGHYIDDASESVSNYYHPIVNMSGEVVSRVAADTSGGPCGDGFGGGVH